MADQIHVLVVDGSAVARLALEEALSRAPDIRVSRAGDASVAQSRIELDPPDVVVLDLELPRTPSLELLRWVIANRPTPVVVCSSHPPSHELVIRALDAGALSAVDRPRDGALAPPAARALIEAVRAAHRKRDRLSARVSGPPPLPGPATRPSSPGLQLPSAARPVASSIVVAIGASTGGTEALAALLPALPTGFPGTVIVQHMPPHYTRTFADRLDRLCAMRVREAADGDRIEDGLVLIAPGGRHTQIARSLGAFVIEVFDGPLVSQHRPSVDVLFHSVARTVGPDSLGLIMTGMGSDGAAGLAAMHSAGARTLGQDEASSTVYGMPRAAAELGAVDIVASLDTLASRLIGAADTLRRP